MSKSVLYATNTTSQAVVVGGVISFGNAVRRYGCNCNISGGNAEVTGTGYYSIDTNFTITVDTAGTTTISLYDDGVIIPGATASLTAIAGSIYAISIPAIVRNRCNCTHTITAVLSGEDVTVTNASIVVEKE